MGEDQQQAEFERLCRRSPRRRPTRSVTILATLKALNDQWIAERRQETAEFVEAFGRDPKLGTRVVDGGTRHRPPGHMDIDSKLVRMPSRNEDGEPVIMSRDELTPHRCPNGHRLKPVPPMGHKRLVMHCEVEGLLYYEDGTVVPWMGWALPPGRATPGRRVRISACDDAGNSRSA